MRPSIRTPHLRAARAALRHVFLPSVLALALAGGGAPLAAQPQAELLGERVRVTSEVLGGEPRTGRVVDAGPAGLFLELQKGGEARALAWGDVSRLEVSQGGRNAGVPVMLLGGVLGAAVGAAAGMGGEEERVRVPGRCSSPNSLGLAFFAALPAYCKGRTHTRRTGSGVGQKALVNGAVFGAVGALAGWLIGRQIELDHQWVDRAVGVEGATVRPSVSGDGAGLALRIPLGSR